MRFWIAFALCANASCAKPPVVVSDCPAPNVEEQDDLESWLFEDGHEPSKAWASRVLGHIYGLELKEVRGE